MSPSSLPTREEVVARIVVAYEQVVSPTRVDAHSYRRLTALAALYPVCVAEEGRQAEAPEGETETGGESTDDDYLGIRRHPQSGPCIVIEREGDGDVFGYASVNDPGVLLGHAGLYAWRSYPKITEPAPPSVPVSTERTDGEMGLGTCRDDEWTVMGGANLKVENDEGVSTLWLDGDGNFMVATCGPEDRARLVRALGGITVPASLPPLTDEDVERAAQAAWEADGSMGWNPRTESARIYLIEARAALASTGLYATPREKG